MYGKLEEALAEYEKKRPIKNDDDLLAALDRVIDKETKKRRGKMDCDLIKEAVDFSLTVRGYDLEKIDGRAKEIARRVLAEYRAPDKVKGTGYKRILAVAAVAAVAAAASVAVIANEEGTSNAFTKEQIESFEEGTVNNLEGVDVLVGSAIDGVDRAEDLPVALGCDILLPSPENGGIVGVTAVDYTLYREAEIIFGEDGKSRMLIKTATSLPDDLEFEEAFGLRVHFSSYSNKYQGEFDFNNCSYRILAPSKEKLLDIIGNLKEASR